MKLTRNPSQPMVSALQQAMPAQPRNGFDTAGFVLLGGALVAFVVGETVHRAGGRR